MKNPPTQRNIKNLVTEYVIIVVICISIVAMIFSFHNREFSYQASNNSSIEYVNAEVLEILEEEFDDDLGYTRGYQKIKAIILEGKAEGKTVEMENYITVGQRVILEEGSGFIACADIPEGITPMFSVYSHDRSYAIFAIILLFIAVVTLVGKKRGLLSCLGLVFTLCMVVCYMVPELFEGGNTFLVTALTLVASTVVSCFCIGGISIKTYNNVLNTLLGVGAACLMYFIFSCMLHLGGSAIEEVEMLSLISNNTGLNIGGILYAGVAISSLGAVMDVAVSIGASLYEIKSVRNEATFKEMLRSGMNIGCDMIGTMTNTLILAFAGGTLATLVIFMSYGIQFDQLISSNFIAAEIAAGVAGSLGIVLTVPLSALVCSYTLNKKIKIKNSDKKHRRKYEY
ncbi:MAG: YibE/F family protein [Clostridia bacterium]|nr:YibE/F family protein [Clostridia bacterium]